MHAFLHLGMRRKRILKSAYLYRIENEGKVPKFDVLKKLVRELSVDVNSIFYGYEKEYTSFEIFSKAIADYIDYYNNRRIQAKTKWMPPVEFREASMM